MKIAIFGSTGMLGHKLFYYLKEKHEVVAFNREDGFEVSCERSTLERVGSSLVADNIDIVLNCIGVIKQLDASRNAISSIEINSLWPHYLARLCQKRGIKLVHFSTDCIFNGEKGNYSESDPPNASDLYGRSKFLGELGYENCLTLRTSIIGHELKRHVSLVDWFLGQKESCNGYVNAIYTGFPTIVLAEALYRKILPAVMDGALSGVWHFSSEPISKYDLLCKIASVYQKDIEILPVLEPKIDRSLNSDLLRQKVGFSPQSWDEMIDCMHQDYKESDLYFS